jgi:hypothetical protein
MQERLADIADTNDPTRTAGQAALHGRAEAAPHDVLIMGGESLAERLVLPPMLAMWSANAVMLGVAIVALQRPRRVSVAH